MKRPNKLIVNYLFKIKKKKKTLSTYKKLLTYLLKLV